MNNFHFGNNLRAVRTSRDLSQKRVAHFLRISQSTYSRLEKMKEIPNDELLDKLGDALLVEKTKLLPSPWLTHPLKKVLGTPIGYIGIMTVFNANAPQVWEFTVAVCEKLGVSEENTILFRILTIPIVPIMIWYCIKVIKRGTK